MKRSISLGVALAMVAAAAPAFAETVANSVVRQLHQQGYTTVTVTQTWLGRTRIDAESATQQREVVVNPRTGEILRDYWSPLNQDGHSVGGVSILSSAGQSTKASDAGATVAAAGGGSAGTSGSTSVASTSSDSARGEGDGHGHSYDGGSSGGSSGGHSGSSGGGHDD